MEGHRKRLSTRFPPAQPSVPVLLLLKAILLLIPACSQTTRTNPPAQELLSRYLRQSRSTDPGRQLFLYKNLPDSLTRLCQLVKQQLIHPVDLDKFQVFLPADRMPEDLTFPKVKEMLLGLYHRNPEGLVFDRSPEQRLVVGCFHHCLLLASILRNQGIPVRIRCGFALYFEHETGLRFGHAICEVWDKRQSRWILVDPDRNRINISSALFQSASSSWQCLRRDTCSADLYIAARSQGIHASLHMLLQDLSCVIGEEKPYWLEPPVSSSIIESFSQIETHHRRVLDELAGLMEQPDDNFPAIMNVVNNHSYLQTPFF